MIDDKGNKVKKMSIVRDAGTNAYWLVIDKNRCVRVDKNIYFESFANLKEIGYIKIEVPKGSIPYSASVVKE